MNHWYDLITAASRNARSELHIRRGWQITAAVFFTASLFFAARLLGSFQPDTDVWRSLGWITLANGGILLTFWTLVRTSQSQTAAGRHSHAPLAAWAGLLFSAAFLLSLSCLPAASLVPILGSLICLLTLGGLFVQMVLDHSAGDTTAATRLLPNSSDQPEPPGNQAENDSATPTSMVPSNPETTSSFDPPTSGAETQLLQWQTRKQAADGSETVEGMIRLELAAGQTQRAAHIPFSPALTGIPEMECEPLTDAPIEAIVGDVYPHGFRVDVRRSNTDRTPLTVEIGFLAQVDQTNKSAA